jgi:glucosamine--fructose-6-phosphate aminotransferase (isomerizing)
MSTTILPVSPSADLGPLARFRQARRPLPHSPASDYTAAMPISPAWHTDGFPELRDGPPWVMAEMIAAQPELLEQIATGADTSALALMVRTVTPLSVVGCGTSEHAAMAVAAMLRDAGTPATARQAFEAALDPQEGGAVIGISHEGGTAATTRALEAARAAGSATGLITAVIGSPATRPADAVLATPMVDRSWCHTIGYTSPIAAGLALAGRPAGGVVHELSTAGLATRDQAASVADRLGGCSRLMIVGSGADRISARELTLKIEEACHLPCAMRDLETFLHGHLPACDESTGLVLLSIDRRQAGQRRERAGQCVAAARRIGLRCALIGRGDRPDGELDAGTIEVPSAPQLPAVADAVLSAALPLQWLAYELALARGTNPDLIRREQEPYREASAIHG